MVKVIVDEGGTLKNEFKLIKGTVGQLRIDYEGDLRKDAVCEFDAKVYGKKDDRIFVKESIFLNGENARGLAKSRIVSSDRRQSEVVGEMVGNAPFARGHVDCVEIIKGKDARASAIPRLVVNDDRAKLTHEASIGSVDKKQVETLMACATEISSGSGWVADSFCGAATVTLGNAAEPIIKAAIKPSHNQVDFEFFRKRSFIIILQVPASVPILY